MEPKTELMRNNTFSMRSLLMVVAIVGAVTTGNLWIHRGSPPLGYSRYTGYGFSVDYSQLMTMKEGDLKGQGPPTDSVGMVQWSRQDKELEQFGVIWIRLDEFSSDVGITLAGALDKLFLEIGSSGTKIGERGQLKTIVKDGHELIYQTFTLEESGISIPGIMSAWSCEASEKYLMLYAIHVPDLYHPEIISTEVETIWLGHLTTLTCH